MNDEINGTKVLPPAIVIIDDEPQIRKAVKRMVSKLNYRIRAYESAFEFYQAIEQGIAGVPDVIITDFNMPEMNGNVLIEKIKESYPAFFHNVPIIGVTGDSMNIDTFLEAGAVDALYKPFNPKELTDILTGLPTTQYFNQQLR